MLRITLLLLPLLALTPSARVLRDLKETGANYSEWILSKSQEHKENFGPMDPETEVYDDLSQRARDSITAQHQLEESDTQNFDAFLKDFLAVTE